MEMSGQQLIPATREDVWAALNDADVLRVCIPGCQELAKSSDTEMTAVAVMKVGPVKARFQGAVTLSELDPPNGYRITGEGQGGVAGFAKGVATVKLEPADSGTVLVYTVDAQIGGKLSQLGGRLIDVTAKQMAGQFFKRFAEEIQARQNAAGEPGRLTPPKSEGVSQKDERSVGRDRARLEAAFSPGPAPAVAVARAGPSIPVLAFVVFVSVLAALWAVYGGLLPSLLPAGDDRGRMSPDLASAVQLIMAAAIGYLFGARAR
ncbi:MULTISPECIES: carbon monoxide dehydrogenase subunit G [unclassified Rhizobium]|uniref:SRPBCC family protein n=1 Tax=unclassified Rhizobium TaxID=2613769 RepID=UPI000EA9AC01|nr:MULTISPECIES: carbon monoxide dehydrogenase subunit G [unclassified Rhizobium]AYG70983.1 carbon monoxide dehydrogenase [Rhizobium sp. CCGE531]AYG77294.1 carbon monoxide dehydrogenase [Rhizobium sp. CCGE532]